LSLHVKERKGPCWCTKIKF